MLSDLKRIYKENKYNFVTIFFEVLFLYYKKKYKLRDDIIEVKNKKYKYYDLRLRNKNSKFVQLFYIYLFLRKKKLKNFTFFDLGCGWGNIVFFLIQKKFFTNVSGMTIILKI